MFEQYHSPEIEEPVIKNSSRNMELKMRRKYGNF